MYGDIGFYYYPNGYWDENYVFPSESRWRRPRIRLINDSSRKYLLAALRCDGDYIINNSSRRVYMFNRILFLHHPNVIKTYYERPTPTSCLTRGINLHISNSIL